jgi:hypothetical protein
MDYKRTYNKSGHIRRSILAFLAIVLCASLLPAPVLAQSTQLRTYVEDNPIQTNGLISISTEPACPEYIEPPATFQVTITNTAGVGPAGAWLAVDYSIVGQLEVKLRSLELSKPQQGQGIETVILPPKMSATYEVTFEGPGSVVFFADLTDEWAVGAWTLQNLLRLVPYAGSLIGETPAFVFEVADMFPSLWGAITSVCNAFIIGDAPAFKELGHSSIEIIKWFNTSSNRIDLLYAISDKLQLGWDTTRVASISTAMAKVSWIYSITRALMDITQFITNVALGEVAGWVEVGASLEQVVNPNVSVNPSSGSWGTKFTANWSGFSPNHRLTQYLQRQGNAQPNVILVATDSLGKATSLIDSQGLSPGTYELWGVDDKSGTTSNLVEFIVTGEADLLAYPVSLSRSSAALGETLSVTFTIKNDGNSSSGPFSTWICASASPFGTENILTKVPCASIAPGNFATVSVSVVVPSSVAPGDYYVTTYADAPGNGVVQELREDNNIGSSTPNKIAIKSVAPTTLTFTSLTPSTITTSTAPYDATLSAGGTNFNNVNRVTFTWSGAVSGSDTWDKGGSDWNNKVTVNSDTSMTLRPRVVETSPTWSGTVTWTVTLRDTTGATASRSFTVTYTPSLTFTSLTPSTITTSTAPYDATLSAGGTNFNNVNRVTFTWSGAVSGSATWDKGGSDWNNKVTVNSDTSMTLRPRVVETSPTWSGTVTWTVTLRDTTGATASRSFTVTYTPSLTFTSLTPSTITTSTAPYDATLSAGGTNFNNVNRVTFTWSGAVSGSATWDKGGSDWNNKVTVNSDTSMTLRPRVVETSPTWSGTVTWTVTLRDTTGATASRSFTVTYTPSLTFTSLTPSTITTSTAPYDATLSAGGTNFNNVNRVTFTWSGAVSGSATWDKGGSDWNNKVTVNSDTSMTLRPRVVETSPTWSGTVTWTVTLRDTTGATASRSFTVTYTPSLTFTSLTPSTITTSTAPYDATLSAGGTNFNNVNRVTFTWSGAVSGSATWDKGGSDWNNKVTVNSDTSMTLRPRVVETSPTWSGTVTWTVTLRDTTGATASRSFTVTYTPSLTFTSLTPSTITTSTAPYDATLSAGGTNFNNVNRVTFTWSGAVSGSATWDKGGSDWNNKVTVNSDTSMTLRPRVVETSPTWSGTVTWTVTLRDTTGATASRSFTVTYTPSLTFTSLTPSTITTSTAPYDATLSAGGTNFNNVNRVTFTWSGAVSGSATWDKGGSDWNNKVTVNSDTSMTLRPRVVETSPTWSGTVTWTVTLRDTTGATASRSFTVTYTPSLTFTSLTPSTITTSTAPYDATLSAGGTNFNNVNRVTFTWSGAVSGSATWDKGGSDWNNKVTVNSDTSMTLRPRVVETSPTWSGTVTWTVTLRDTTGATASRSFTVTYTP